MSSRVGPPRNTLSTAVPATTPLSKKKKKKFYFGVTSPGHIHDNEPIRLCCWEISLHQGPHTLCHVSHHLREQARNHSKLNITLADSAGIGMVFGGTSTMVLDWTNGCTKRENSSGQFAAPEDEQPRKQQTRSPIQKTSLVHPPKRTFFLNKKAS